MTATKATEHDSTEGTAMAPAAVAPQPAPGATPPQAPPLIAKVAAELVGTAALVAIVVGSGIQATELTTPPPPSSASAS